MADFGLVGKLLWAVPLIGLRAASAFPYAEPLSGLQRPSPQLHTGCMKCRALPMCDIPIIREEDQTDSKMCF